ncbi:MAG TPA: hypothetical protein VG164_15975 [Trebonia sp.]|jgi:glyoxylase-like metal-dependent hydrolase (beta-lactamase superfamily II)|nr:hypothetical protein [Trebonia sp.]
MCSDVEIPLLDLESADPLGSYRAALDRLASVAGVRVVVPGHGRPGDAAAFRSRLAADAAYLDALPRPPAASAAADFSAAADSSVAAAVTDPRLAAAPDWLLADHARQLAFAMQRPAPAAL